MDQERLFKAIRKTWPNGRPDQQQGATALLVHTYLGGEILFLRIRGKTINRLHYINRIGEQIVDLTGTQFPADALRTEPQPVMHDCYGARQRYNGMDVRKYLLDTGNVRLRRLKKQVEKELLYMPA